MPRSRRSRRGTKREPENLSDVAAWLYTDLLLGLAVVFIGGGAFTLRAYGPEAPDTSSVQANPSWYLSCNEVEFEVSQNISGADLENRTTSAIFKASKAYGWDEPRPGLVQIFGFDADTSVGERDAVRFRDGPVARSETLKNSKVLTAGDRSQGKNPNSVRVRIFVVFKGLEINNGCKNN